MGPASGNDEADESATRAASINFGAEHAAQSAMNDRKSTTQLGKEGDAYDESCHYR